MAQGLLNYSALARTISAETGCSQFDALVVALRRRAAQLQQSERERDARVIDLVRRARITVKNRMAVVIVNKPREYEDLYYLQRQVRRERGHLQFLEVEEAAVIITNSAFLPQVRELFNKRIIKVTEQLALVTLIFDRRIETTIGVVAYLYSRLAERGINILEEVSCWTDFTFVVQEREVPQTLAVLNGE